MADTRYSFRNTNGPIVVIGHEASLFPKHMVKIFQSLGYDAWLITGDTKGAHAFSHGGVTSSADSNRSLLSRIGFAVLSRLLRASELVLHKAQRARYKAAMGSETEYRPLVTNSIMAALTISKFVNSLHPRLVLGQEVFAYGLATVFCKGCPRVLVPWGGDVYMYGASTSLALTMMKYVLQSADLVISSSVLAADHIASRFEVKRDKIYSGGWWVLDRKQFQPADSTKREKICLQYGINPEHIVVMNIRRFLPAWGSDLALESFVRYAKENENAHFIFLGGAGSEHHLRQARQRLESEGLAARFTLCEGDIPLSDCAKLMSISHIAVSLMRERDFRPLASVMQAVASGAAPILSDQPEYRHMEQRGFKAQFVNLENMESIVEAIRSYTTDFALRQQTAAQNFTYLSDHEDGAAEVKQLMERLMALPAKAQA